MSLTRDRRAHGSGGGILVANGAEGAKLSELTPVAEQTNVTIEIVAPVVGGVETSDGRRVPADQKTDGGPCVLYDAVVVLASGQGASMLAALPASPTSSGCRSPSLSPLRRAAVLAPSGQHRRRRLPPAADERSQRPNGSGACPAEAELAAPGSTTIWRARRQAVNSLAGWPSHQPVRGHQLSGHGGVGAVRRGHPVGFQNSAAGPGLAFYAARSYSLMRPPRTGRRRIRLRERPATGWSGRGGRR